MVMCIFGESCTGKSTLANNLKQDLDATVYSDKDYLKLANNENDAKKLFENKLKEAIEVIKERFQKRMKGNLPLPITQMLERKHGCFDDVICDIHLHGSNYDYKEIIYKIAL